MNAACVEPVAIVNERAKRSLATAILSGALVTVATHVMLDLLGAGIGLGFLPKGDSTSRIPQAIAMGAGVWWLVVTIIAVGTGAFVAGRLWPTNRRGVAATTGIAAWATSSFIWLAAMTTVLGGTLAGAFGVMNDSVDVLRTRQAMTFSSNVSGMTQDGEQPAARVVRPAITAPRTITEEEAKEAAKIAGAAAFWGFLGLALSAGAACFAAIAGAKREAIIAEVRTVS